MHGLFDNDALRYKIFNEINANYRGYNFKEFKSNAIAEFAEHINTYVDINKILDKINFIKIKD